MIPFHDDGRPVAEMKKIVPQALLLIFVLLWPGSSPLASPSVAAAQEEDAFARGVQAYSNGEYVQAEKLLAAYLKTNPHGVMRDLGLLWYGRSLMALHRTSEAQAIAASMDKEFPNSPLTRKLHDEIQKLSVPRKSSSLSKEAAGEAPVRAISKKPTAVKQKAATSTTISPVGETEGVPSTPSAMKKGPAPRSRPSAVVAPKEKSGRIAEQPARSSTAKLASRQESVTKAGAQKQGKQGRPSASQKVKRERAQPVKAKAKSETGVASKKESAIQKKSGAVAGGETTGAMKGYRDPFRPLVVRSSEAEPLSLPPGRKGLQVNRLILKGIVKTGNGYLAMVQPSPSSGTILLRENDSLYDGQVEKIYDDRVVFTHFGTDNLGKMYQEEITKRLTGASLF
jgi:hypothetical protein